MMQEGAAVARSYAMAKNYHVDGNKEMITFGAMNMTGSCSSCYLTAGPFSRSAVNRDSGCRTAVSNAVMAAVVALTLLFLTPLFRHTPQASLSAIIFSAMLVNVDLPAAARLWRVDNPDFFVCLGAFLGVVFGSVELGLCVAVGASVLRVLLLVARPRTTALGRMPGSAAYRRMDQYAVAGGARAARRRARLLGQRELTAVGNNHTMVCSGVLRLRLCRFESKLSIVFNRV
jgi:sulfate transporter 3